LAPALDRGQQRQSAVELRLDYLDDGAAVRPALCRQFNRTSEKTTTETTRTMTKNTFPLDELVRVGDRQIARRDMRYIWRRQR
jgi:hypothetical protein